MEWCEVSLGKCIHITLAKHKNVESRDTSLASETKTAPSTKDNVKVGQSVILGPICHLIHNRQSNQRQERVSQMVCVLLNANGTTSTCINATLMVLIRWNDGSFPSCL